MHQPLVEASYYSNRPQKIIILLCWHIIKFVLYYVIIITYVSFFLVILISCLIPLALFYNERIVTECCCGFGKGFILVVGRVETRKKYYEPKHKLRFYSTCLNGTFYC